jgi:hypothetical protein
MVKTDVVGPFAAAPELWLLERAGDEGEDDVGDQTSLWEAEMSALDDEQLLALEESAEDE